MFRFGSLIKRKRELKDTVKRKTKKKKKKKRSKRERLIMRGGMKRRGGGDFISIKGHSVISIHLRWVPQSNPLDFLVDRKQISLDMTPIFIFFFKFVSSVFFFRYFC